VIKRVLLFLVFLTLSASAAQAQATTVYFVSDTPQYIPGSAMTIRWKVTGVDLAIIEVYDLADPSAPIASFFNLPLEDTLDVPIPRTALSGVRLILWAANYPNFPIPVAMYARLASISLDVPAACLPTFYFDGEARVDDCLPAVQYPVQAAYQPFEDGFMLWRGDSGEVWVLEKTGRARRYSESVYGLLPDNPITDEAPSGYSKPILGFGRVWGNFEEVRETLGWALGGEQGYTMTVQFTQAPIITSYFYMTLPDAQVIRIMSSGMWTFETPDE
jgi:hypothetical protein